MTNDQEDDYKIGYGCPPKETQFKKGVSGNPSGRPKKQKTMEDIVEEVMRRPITVSENGRVKKIPTQSAMVIALAKKALQGDIQAIKFLAAYLPQDDYDDDQPMRITIDMGIPNLEERQAAYKAEEATRGASAAIEKKSP